MASIEDINYTETDTNNTNQVQNDIINNTEDSDSYETWMQSILRAPETDSEDEEIMLDEPIETWEEFSKDLEPPYSIHLRDEGICNSLHGTMAFSTGLNQAATASLNRKERDRVGQALSLHVVSPFHQRSSGSRVPVPDGTSRGNPTCLPSIGTAVTHLDSTGGELSLRLA